MGGFEAVERLDALGASFEAQLAREEEAAADDLAFALRQDVGLREAVLRSRSAWALLMPGGAAIPLAEAGSDYVGGAGVVVPAARASLRSAQGRPPAVTEDALLDVLGRVCRAGLNVTVFSGERRVTGRLVRVATDHLAVRTAGDETIVGIGAVDAVRVGGYSASRGLSG